jgi:hypothetical protein
MLRFNDFYAAIHHYCEHCMALQHCNQTVADEENDASEVEEVAQSDGLEKAHNSVEEVGKSAAGCES